VRDSSIPTTLPPYHPTTLPPPPPPPMLTKFRSLSREVVPVHLCGNVTIDPSAAIAPGVLIQADPSSRVTIGAGVCIGAGTIVQASGGDIDIAEGVCIGRRVLIMGSGSIERNACIGAGTTAIDPQIAAGAAIPPDTLLGDRSRAEVTVVEPDEPPIEPKMADVPPPEDLWDTSDAWDTSGVESPIEETPAQTEPQSEEQTTTTFEIERITVKSVSGRANFDRLKRQLFPNG
jgi:carbon dioxide concentrating mechanism protein CcmN